jgi:hypothetical protein
MELCFKDHDLTRPQQSLPKTTTSNMSLPHTELPPRSQRYKHSLLDKHKKDIRVVQIKPDANPENPIQLVFRNVKLAHRHIDARKVTEHSQPSGSFIALSYAWGPETPSSDVHIEDSNGSGWLSIRQNLHDFLTTRRDSYARSPWFWIDQLCINQEDNEERGHQVNQMSQIYSKAIKVEVWLGVGFEGSDEAMDFMHKSVVFPGEWQKKRKVVHNKAMDVITRLPYWSRLWIVQEIVLGQNITVRLGNKTVLWPTEFASAPTIPLLETVTYISGLPGGYDWGTVYLFAKKRACTDVRERVFGMMGLVLEPLHFYPDYTMRLHDVLLMMLRRQTAFLVSHESRYHYSIGDSFAIYDIELCAQEWLWILDPEHREIDPKLVRHFLSDEVHPLLQRTQYMDHLRERDGAASVMKVGSSLTMLARLRLWWLFPNRNSRLRRYHRRWQKARKEEVFSFS